MHGIDAQRGPSEAPASQIGIHLRCLSGPGGWRSDIPTCFLHAALSICQAHVGHYTEGHIVLFVLKYAQSLIIVAELILHSLTLSP